MQKVFETHLGYLAHAVNNVIELVIIVLKAISRNLL